MVSTKYPLALGSTVVSAGREAELLVDSGRWRKSLELGQVARQEQIKTNVVLMNLGLFMVTVGVVYGKLGQC